jgi:hypothetical protein
MIIRRITAVAAGMALAGTAFAAPAMAKTNTTTVKLDANTLNIISAVQISPSAVKPAKAKGTTVTIPAKLKGKNITHKGGIKLATADGSKFLTVENITINSKGKGSADVNQSLLAGQTLPIKNILTFTGGKNTIKKNGKWMNAKVALAKSVTIPGIGKKTTQFVLASIFGLPEDTVNQVLPGAISLGTANIVVKK